MFPSSYLPTRPEEFIGSARRLALIIDQLIARSRPSGVPIKLLLLGPPGVGKSALSHYLATRLGVDKWSASRFNGTQVKVDEADALAASLHFTDLFGAYRFVQIEEVDKVPTVAQVRLLTLLDDLPRKVAVVCTSNCRPQDLEERFQSRFLVMEVAPPAVEEIRHLLGRWPEIAASVALEIATFCCGNVRQALLDADGALLATAA